MSSMPLFRSVTLTLAGGACLMASTLMGARQPAAREPVKIYGELCASCHGPNLEGALAQNLLDNTWKFGGDDDSLSKSIRDGNPTAGMPPMGGVLSEAEIKAMVAFIRQQAAARRNQPPPIVPWVEGAVFETERHTFKLETVADKLETPWGLAFLPDGRILVTERPGRLRIVEKGVLHPEPVGGIPPVWAEQDGGLFDVEVHPDYKRNGWIYLAYAEAAPAPNAEKASMTVIVRGRLKNNQWVDQETLYRAPPSLYLPSNVHYGSRFRFDRAGHLFYSIGDRGRDPTAQELSEPTGKIHRVMDDGKAAPGNPFANRTGAIATIWSYGHRNPQGLAFHPVTGQLWSTEHGPRDGDELNRIVAGHNYGWPVITHGTQFRAKEPGPIAHEGMEQAVVSWTPAIAPGGIEFYTGSRFPNWKNDLFVTGLVGQALRRLTIDGDAVTHQEILFKGIGRVRDIVTGPDGYPYIAMSEPGARVSSTTPGRIVRLVPATAGKKAGARTASASDAQKENSR